MTVKQLVERAQNVFGFDLESAALIELLNDARQDAARLTEYPRKVVEAEHENGVVEQPEDFLLALNVSVDGVPFANSDRETIRQFENGELVPTGRGYWYDYTDEEGTEVVKLYPAPESTSTVELEYVYCGLDWSIASLEKGVPSEFPRWFHPKLLHFMAAIYYETVEDNPELGEFQKGKAEAAAGDLIRFKNEREGGDGIFTVGIVGQTA